MDDSDGLTERPLERMIAAIRPDWSLVEATPTSEGTDDVYFVTMEAPAGAREGVLKVCTSSDPAAFRPEPYLLALLDRRTSIPVPKAIGAVDDHDDLPAPFFLMEKCDGEVLSRGEGSTRVDLLERVARDAGRYLGEAHGLGDFGTFGPLRLEQDAVEPGNAVVVDSRRLTIDRAHGRSWRARFAQLSESYLGALDERFADLEPDLRAFVEDRLDALDRSFTPVLGNEDYRPGNLIVDAETGETTVVLDWGNVYAMDAQFNLVLTEEHLVGWGPLDDPRRERIRTAIREGYAVTNSMVRDEAFERRRGLYLVVARLWPLIWFSAWNADAAESEREARAEMHRRFLSEFIA